MTSIDWTQMKTAEHIETERLEQATESARNTETLNWEAPEPYPDDDKFYEWDEETQSWVEVTEENE